MDICGHCECGPDQIKQEDVGCFCETRRAPVQRRSLGDQEEGPLSQMRDQQEQGPPLKRRGRKRDRSFRRWRMNCNQGWTRWRRQWKKTWEGRKKAKKEKPTGSKTDQDMMERMMKKLKTELQSQHVAEALKVNFTKQMAITSFRSRSCSWQRRSQPQKKIHQSESYDTGSYSICSDEYNFGTSEGTKDPKCADSKEARAVCAVGVVYRAHLGKTKTTLWYF